ncbi:uncharacterized protein BCR38DRAFT_339244 [Pseudomassariella vexata]|uniref:Cora-domain-containing protein n=1 Tax=Pseudomassariella vexata TaxID=1141098 RepID=A0A1Y2E5U4_9PEZI|nr:uncharacterized protein BCR38DRAFT_339244 [Pseudomassariella vexata]ORY66235.1 hypothetical protein BCR38DRAFT_339244 [Pseudomassariella vexata]
MASTNPFAPLASSLHKQSFSGPSEAPDVVGNAPRTPTSRKKKHRAGRKHRRKAHQSFAGPSEDMPGEGGLDRTGSSDARPGIYAQGHNLSCSSIDSEALLDHRDRTFSSHLGESAPLLSSSGRFESGSPRVYGSNDGRPKLHDRFNDRRGSSRSSRRHLHPLLTSVVERYNVNYPPSMPPSPKLGPLDRMGMSFGDAMMREEFADMSQTQSATEGETGARSPSFDRRHTIALGAEDDVAIPQEGMSEMGDERPHDAQSDRRRRRRRGKWPDLSILEEWSREERKSRSLLEDRRIKTITEPELINGRLRPLNKGLYRPEEDFPWRFTYFSEDLPRTIHTNTISELTEVESDEVPPLSFRELFNPEAPILCDSSDSENDEEPPPIPFQTTQRSTSMQRGEPPSRIQTRTPSLARAPMPPEGAERNRDGAFSPRQLRAESAAPSRQQSAPEPEKPIRYGKRPTWWLDVLCPSPAEMRVLQQAFRIHSLTSEDIMMKDEREKIELFPHYYFVNYRSFEQDSESDTHLEPVNMYIIVFRDGLISFHHSPTPHPANVRRRLRQLADFRELDSDWMSYAIIDEITDIFVPLIQKIEEEVDDIDDAILRLHAGGSPKKETPNNNDRGEKDARSISGETVIESGADMLHRVGNCRKKVMGLYRLLGNKADVIKGFAKRCNESWAVAPKSDIGMYLGDIQDHIVTMTANLSHYEMILSRSHANYLAQINIRMNERSEETADTLGKLTVLGTIVLPMNIITGLWGMNVWVPGQEYEGNLNWFWAITAGLLLFGGVCYFTAKRVYKIV